jgi:DNA repair protein RadA/Sms
MKFLCNQCGYESLKWEGRCGSCGQWGSLEEFNEISPKEGVVKEIAKGVNVSELKKGFGEKNNSRLSSGFEELDRVLGGGFVSGQVVLLAGEPGVGKSTLLLQAALNISEKGSVLYVSVEESLSQIYSRYKRLSKGKEDVGKNLMFSEEMVTEKIINLLEKEKPTLCIVDSIQALESSQATGITGGVSQIRVNGYLLTKAAKRLGIPVILVGQITKDGVVAGPKVLEHIVDSVLNLHGDEFNMYRVLRSMKNRYGATSEIGVFEMNNEGLVEVKDPSQIFVQESQNSFGSSISAVLKGTRVMFIEVQALTSDVVAENVPPRRVANGIKKSRLDMLCAVLSRRGGVYLNNKDVFVNVVGGLKIDDPSVDLAVCAAMKSAVLEKSLDNKFVYVGEVGLTGEVRGCFGWDSIVKETKRLGYKGIYASKFLKSSIKSLKISPIEHVKEL